MQARRRTFFVPACNELCYSTFKTGRGGEAHPSTRRTRRTHCTHRTPQPEFQVCTPRITILVQPSESVTTDESVNETRNRQDLALRFWRLFSSTPVGLAYGVTVGCATGPIGSSYRVTFFTYKLQHAYYCSTCTCTYMLHAHAHATCPSAMVMDMQIHVSMY